MKHACEQVSHLASEQLERKLSLYERLSIRIHFLMCHACRQYNQNITKLHKVLQLRLQAKGVDVQLPEEKRKIIKQVIQSSVIED